MGMASGIVVHWTLGASVTWKSYPRASSDRNTFISARARGAPMQYLRARRQGRGSLVVLGHVCVCVCVCVCACARACAYVVRV